MLLRSRQWPTVTLDQMVREAGLQSRVDRKYVADSRQLSVALDATADRIKILQIDDARAFGYRTVYFDTPNLTSYYAAATNRSRRFKVRTRTYLAAGTTWLEVKLRERTGLTHKHRIEHDLETELDDAAVSFLHQFEQVRPHLDVLQPTIETTYERTTLVCATSGGSVAAPAAAQRITIDHDTVCARPDGTPIARVAGHVIVETKSHDARPGPFDRALWRAGVRPLPISKYAIGIASSRAVPANRWQRVLSRYVEVPENVR